jgi:hypothetical protein
MSFYSIKTTTEKKIIGLDYPQIQTMGGAVNRDAPNSLYNVYPNELPDFTPNLNYFVLSKDAKLTDVLSSAMISYGFIINDKVKNILGQFKLPPCKFYPARVEYKGMYYNNYYWFFFVCDILDFIDYDKTEFFITDLVHNKIEDCKNIISSNSLRNLKEVLVGQGYINSNIIYLKQDTAFPYDLFEITFGNYRIYISCDLKNALQENNIKGLDFDLASRISV